MPFLKLISLTFLIYKALRMRINLMPDAVMIWNQIHIMTKVMAGMHLAKRGNHTKEKPCRRPRFAKRFGALQIHSLPLFDYCFIRVLCEWWTWTYTDGYVYVMPCRWYWCCRYVRLQLQIKDILGSYLWRRWIRKEARLSNKMDSNYRMRNVRESLIQLKVCCLAG